MTVERRRTRLPAHLGPRSRRRAGRPSSASSISSSSATRPTRRCTSTTTAATRRAPSNGSCNATTPAKRRSTSSSAAGVFVDLLNVVRQGIRASVESYSIKRIEHFYMSQREGPVTEAGFSVVQYETWRRDDDASAAPARRTGGLQPRRLHLDLEAARLARGEAPGSHRPRLGDAATAAAQPRPER